MIGAPASPMPRVGPITRLLKLKGKRPRRQRFACAWIICFPEDNMICEGKKGITFGSTKEEAQSMAYCLAAPELRGFYELEIPPIETMPLQLAEQELRDALMTSELDLILVFAEVPE